MILTYFGREVSRFYMNSCLGSCEETRVVANPDYSWQPYNHAELWNIIVSKHGNIKLKSYIGSVTLWSIFRNRSP